MELREFLLNNGRLKAPEFADPLTGYINYINKYIGDEDLVDFCFDAMLNGVDFELAEHAKWSAISPDFNFITLKTHKNNEVRIVLKGALKSSFQDAKKNSVTDYIFENQSTLVAKAGGIILLSTGIEAYHLKDFNDLYDIILKPGCHKSISATERTKLCFEPWEARAEMMNGEIAPCSQLPPIWNFENIKAMSDGISFFRDSLLKGNLNCACNHCKIKPDTSVSNLQLEVEARRLKNMETSFVDQLRSLYKTNDHIILPPPDLRFRISGTSDDRIFVRNGIQGSTQMMHYVEKYNQYKEPSVLDWGCGCGRYATYILKKWPQFSYTGSDIDHEAIDWCSNNIDGGTFVVNAPYPPTSFIDEQFSSVIGSSVMTHLNKKHQLLWLEEIYRILKPGGIFVASVLGFTAAAKTEGLNARIKSNGIADDHLDPALDGIAPKGYYRDVFQTEEYTRKHWTEFFEIREYLPAGLMGYQDLVVLVKKEPHMITRRKTSWLSKLLGNLK